MKTTTQPATHTPGQSAAQKLNYAAGKLGLIPAFGDSIGKDVNKAELSLARSYVQSAAESHEDLLFALEDQLENTREDLSAHLENGETERDCAFLAERIAAMKGGTP